MELDKLKEIAIENGIIHAKNMSEKTILSRLSDMGINPEEKLIVSISESQDLQKKGYIVTGIFIKDGAMMHELIKGE